VSQTFDEEFNTAHPVFHWLFRVSRNWTGVAELLPAMREHLQSTGYIQTTSSPSGGMNSRESLDGDDDSSYSATFRELFCVTAQEIARSLDMSLHNLGTLYEDVLTTGTLLHRMIYYNTPGQKAILASELAASSNTDLEAGHANPILFGKGQLLVLTRRVDSTEGNRLQNLGYRFANMEQVGDQLARSLQVSRDDLENLVGRLDSFSKRKPAVPSRGAYLASFLIQPSPALTGLDVIVPRVTPDRLPMVKLSDEELDHSQMRILAKFNGISLDECLNRINKRVLTSSNDDLFLDKFRNKIHDLLRGCPEPTLRRATFSARQIDIAHGMTGQKDVRPATVFAFCGIKEIYNQSLQSLSLKTISLSFFQTYLRSYPGCPDHLILAQRNHKEFTSLARVSTNSKVPSARYSRLWLSRMRGTSQCNTPEPSWRPESSSEKRLVHSPQPSEGNVHPWGSIMVTSTQNMTVDEGPKDGDNLEIGTLGVRSEIGMAETEKPTLADRLMSITTGFRDPHTARALPKELYYGRR
jgi:hypothetical protein